MAATVVRTVLTTCKRITPALARLPRNTLHRVDLRSGRPAFRVVAPCQTCFRRWQSTAAGTNGETVNEDLDEGQDLTWLQKAKKRSWLWRWLNDVDEIERNLMSDEEYEEREKLIQKMMDMYFDTPNKKWDLSLYQEIFQVLIKYNDRIGVETFWEMMKEMQVDPDQELRENVESYLVKAREAAWFE